MLERKFQSINIYQKALNVAWLKNQVISNNISNVNTPGYKRLDIKFESILRDHISNDSPTLKRTHSNYILLNDVNNMNPRITKSLNTNFRKDENNVNIDVVMAELGKNSIKFSSLAQQLSSNLKRLKMSITDGRK